MLKPTNMSTNMPIHTPEPIHIPQPYPLWNTPPPNPTLVLNGEIYSSKNSRRLIYNNNLPKFIKSKQSLNNEKTLAKQLQIPENKSKWLSQYKTLNHSPAFLCFFFTRQTTRKWDFNNLSQGIMDALVKAEYIQDDHTQIITPLLIGTNKNATTPKTYLYLLPDTLTMSIISAIHTQLNPQTRN